MKRSLGLLLFALAALALPACASIDRGIDKSAEAAANLLLPTSSEVQLGNELARDVERQEPELRDPAVQAYVQRVGARLVEVAGDDVREGITFHFTVLDRPNEVNAFALPGGHIYVYSGLIAAAGSEAELASVLAHEIGHVTERHGAESMVKALGLQTVAGLALGQDPGTVATLAANIAGGGVLAQNSRDNERQADAHGLSYLIRAGYDPYAFPAFFRKLQRLGDSGSDVVTRFFATHPEPGKRAAVAERNLRLRELPRGPAERIGGFEQMQARIGPSRAVGAREAPGRKVTGVPPGAARPPPPALPPPPPRSGGERDERPPPPPPR